MPRTIAPERLSDIIALIYDAALDPARWVDVLASILDDVGLHGAALSLTALPDHHSLLNVTSNIAEPFASAMPDMLPHLAELWGGNVLLLSVPLDEPSVLSRLVGIPNDDNGNPAWRDWMRPQGFSDVVAVTIARDPFGVGALSMGRHRDGPPIDDATIARLKLFIPHLQRAATINRMLDLAALREATFAALFDTLAAPIVLVGRGLAICHANAAARQLLARGVTLRSRNGSLTTSDRSAEAALAAAVRRAVDDASGIGRMGLSIPLPGDDATAQALHVLPLRQTVMGADAQVAIFVAGRANTPAVVGDAMEALFKLTRAESAVLAHVVTGRGVAGAARALGIAPSTVRTHLLRLYDKTGVRRQAELVHMAASLTVPIARGHGTDPHRTC